MRMEGTGPAEVAAEVGERHEQREERGLALLGAHLAAQHEEGHGRHLAQHGRDSLEARTRWRSQMKPHIGVKAYPQRIYC